MKDLKVLENELVPVYETSTGEKVVYGTELYEVLNVKSKFADWVKNRLVECDAVENIDYGSFSKSLEKPKGGRPCLDYIIKLDTAKEMAMLERNEKGKQVRRYFINVEKKYSENQTQEKVTLSKSGRNEIMMMNARTRMAQTYLKLSQVDTLSSTYKVILVAKAGEALAGKPILPLPKSERKVYSAGGIGEMFGITSNKIGRISNKQNLKIEKYGEYRRSKSEHSSKEVDTWVYFDSVIPVLANILNKEPIQI